MHKYQGEIQSVRKDSPLRPFKIKSGDFLLRINGQVITDLIDYQYAVADSELEIEFMKSNSKLVTVNLELEEGQDLGLEFTNPVFDQIMRCHNDCIFCFVDQLPKGLRSSLYVRDDDYRLSFLYGNFVTMTQLDEEALERIRTLNLSPLYLSVHTTNPKLRKQMLRCRKQENVLKQIEELTSYGVFLHTQIVVLPGINDGDELERTIIDLAAFSPMVMSIGVVPVGRTKYSSNDEWMPFENFTQRDAVRTRNIVEGLQKKFKKRLGETLVFLADEIYLQTGGDFPSEEHYEDFPQYENGIGIVRSLYTEIRELKHTIPKELNKQKQFTVVTGVSAHPIIKGIAEDLNRKIRLLNLDVLPITNQFFGTTVTVTGLICGVDLIEQLNNTYAREKDHRVILIPDIMLNEDRFLDDITLDIVREETGLDVYPFTTGFEGLLEALINY